MNNKSPKKIGVFILPSLFTSANLFCGFYSIISVMKSDYTTAAITILLAMLFDAFDGKIARLTNSASRFGVEYDSLADLVSFGVAPGLLIYTWALNGYGKLGWLAVFLFVVCGAMRLARFNTQAGNVESKHFIGLPIPAAAGLIASTVIFDNHILGMGKEVRPIVILVVTYIVAYLMVSNIQYRSFKDIHLRERKPLSTLIAVIMILIIVVAEPHIMLFGLFSLYAFSGPAERFLIPAIKGISKKLHLGKTDVTQD